MLPGLQPLDHRVLLGGPVTACSAAGQTALRSVDEGIADLEEIAAAGLRGVMMPGTPGTEEDYDDPVWAPFWEAAVDLGLPLSFHILTARGQGWRGPRLNSFMSIVRSIQDIMGTLVFGGVFQRHPGLKVVCVEADAGWVPHYMYRMDHAWNRHRNWLAPGVTLERKPSEYFAEHIYVTFQDDWTAFRFADDMNWHRLMWANDFPHSDSTWPWSQELLAEQTVQLTPEQTKAILSDNVADALQDRHVAVRPRRRRLTSAPPRAGSRTRAERRRYSLKIDRYVAPPSVAKSVCTEPAAAT